MDNSASLKRLSRKGRVLRASEFQAAGIPRVQLSRWVREGKLQRLAPGLYASPNYQPSEHGSLATVAHRAPRAVFCLLTALRFHDLTTQAPFEIWIAIGNKDKPPRLKYPPLRVVRFSAASLAEGIEVHTVEGVSLRVTSVARTVVDCFKFRNKIGLDVALEALREARRGKRASTDEMWRYAELCRVSNVMRPYLESVA